MTQEYYLGGYPRESVSTHLFHQWLSGQAPLYLADDCCLVSNSTRRSLWSTDVPTFMNTFTNTQQLWWQNFCSRWTSLVELSSGPAVQSRHHLRMTAKGRPFPGSMNSVTSDMQHLRKTLTYLLGKLYCVAALATVDQMTIDKHDWC